MQEAVVSLSVDYELAVATTGDVLPSLVDALNICTIELAEPVNPSLVSDEEVEIKKRCVREWQRWVAMRGSKSAKFRRVVREAYDSTCLVCGIRLPYRGAGTKAGVDAAHILPWSEYDLDAVSNGVCLCKIHHWAFDERLIRIIRHERQVEIIVPESAIRANEESREQIDLGFLRAVEGVVPAERLPKNMEDWPSADFINRLEADGV